jgi:DNA helicase MCM8
VLCVRPLAAPSSKPATAGHHRHAGRRHKRHRRRAAVKRAAPTLPKGLACAPPCTLEVKCVPCPPPPCQAKAPCPMILCPPPCAAGAGGAPQTACPVPCSCCVAPGSSSSGHPTVIACVPPCPVSAGPPGSTPTVIACAPPCLAYVGTTSSHPATVACPPPCPPPCDSAHACPMIACPLGPPTAPASCPKCSGDSACYPCRQALGGG